MEVLPFRITDGGKRGIIIAEKEYFERDCILRVVSEYTHEYFISFYPNSEYLIEISITAKDNGDMQIRIDLEKEFGQLRQRIVDYAFLSVEKTRV